MTWKEFKEQVEEAGVMDDNEIFKIDTGECPHKLSVHRDADGVAIFGD